MRSSTTPLQDGRFLLLERLGEGGSAVVLGAFDRCDRRAVALKMLREAGRPAGPGHPLAAEFDATIRADHPNVIEAIDLGVAAHGPLPTGAPYLVMEHVPGVPLDRAPVGRADGAWLLSIAAQCLRALRRVHDAGLVHRDVKPDNLLLTSTADDEPHVKLADFGLAVPVGTRRPLGQFSGSMRWVAPECLLGGALDGRADLYALGLVLGRLATGEGPPDGADPRRLIEWHLAGPAIDPAGRRPDLPEGLVTLVRRLSCRDPARRFADAAEALAACGLADEGAMQPPEAVPRDALTAARLALDAARLGAWRRVELPDDPAAAAVVRRELRVQALQRGVSHCRIDDAAAPLARAVLRLLCAAGDPAALARRHRLDRVLPLRLVGGEPLLDERSARSGSSRAVARRVGAALLAIAAARPLVLEVAARRRDSPGGSLGRWLARRIEPPAPPGRGLGGLLLVA